MAQRRGDACNGRAGEYQMDTMISMNIIRCAGVLIAGRGAEPGSGEAGVRGGCVGCDRPLAVVHPARPSAIVIVMVRCARDLTLGGSPDRAGSCLRDRGGGV